MKATIAKNMHCMIETTVLTGLYAGILYMSVHFILNIL